MVMTRSYDYQRNSSNSDAPTAEESTYAQRMEAYDRLPQVVRQELSNALLDYTAIHFYQEWRMGMKPLQLLEVLWKANIRDHKTKASKGEVCRIPDDKLQNFTWNPAPIRAARTSVR
jgi:hypothetical protein